MLLPLLEHVFSIRSCGRVNLHKREVAESSSCHHSYRKYESLRVVFLEYADGRICPLFVIVINGVRLFLPAQNVSYVYVCGLVVRHIVFNSCVGNLLFYTHVYHAGLET